MKKIVLSLVLFLTTVMLSGCIFPYWGDDDYYGGHHRGYRDDGYRDHRNRDRRW